ncbi:MAG TPA: phosphotransferase [Blastocatellia bacterium]|nr:phosphotransferase [Blastocatellia bacterium]
MSSSEARQAPPSDAVARLLGAVFGARRVAGIQMLSEGLCNFNYKVDLDSGAESVLLRIYGRDPDACRKEARLLGLLKDVIPVPEVLQVSADGLDGVGPFIVLRYVEGITFRQLRRTRDREAVAQAAHSIGETLAALGHCEFPHHGAPGPAAGGHLLNGPQAIPEFIDSCLASPALRSRLDEETCRRVHALAWCRARELDRLRDEACLVHGDFNNRNVLVRREQGRWRVAAVIDWEFAASGSPLFDIASFLQYERLMSPSREPHFSRGYRDGGGRLPEGWWQLARVVGLARQCGTLAGAHLPAEIATEVAGLVRETIRENPG